MGVRHRPLLGVLPTKHQISPYARKNQTCGAASGYGFSRPKSFENRSVAVAARELESIFDEADFGGGDHDDLDDIEAECDVRHFEQSEPFHRAADDQPALFLIHGIERATERFNRASLDLHEDKLVMSLVATDDIDLPSMRGAKIPPEDFVAVAAQIPDRNLFSSTSELDVRRLRRARLGQPAHSCGDEPDKGHGYGVFQDVRGLGSLCVAKIHTEDTRDRVAPSSDPSGLLR